MRASRKEPERSQQLAKIRHQLSAACSGLIQTASRPASAAAAVTTDNSDARSSIALPVQDGGGGVAQEGCNNAARGAGRLQLHGAV
jgi:hypothetical protein